MTDKKEILKSLRENYNEINKKYKTFIEKYELILTSVSTDIGKQHILMVIDLWKSMNRELLAFKLDIKTYKFDKEFEYDKIIEILIASYKYRKLLNNLLSKIEHKSTNRLANNNYIDTLIVKYEEENKQYLGSK